MPLINFDSPIVEKKEEMDNENAVQIHINNNYDNCSLEKAESLREKEEYLNLKENDLEERKKILDAKEEKIKLIVHAMIAKDEEIKKKEAFLINILSKI